MARKKFLQDLERAKAKSPSNITEIERFDDDGVSFVYHYPRPNARRSVQLKLIAANIDVYPDGNSFIFFAEDLDVDPSIAGAIEQIQASLDGSSISTAIREITSSLDIITDARPVPVSPTNASSSQAPPTSDKDDSDGDDLDEEYNDDSNFGLADILSTHDVRPASASSRDYRSKEGFEAMRLDLSTAKEAGFKIGVHGNLLAAGIVCVSVRTFKLGISEEAMRAWGLSPNDYLVLLIRFQQGYKSLAYVKEMSNLVGPVEMRAGICDSYKPRVEEAFARFEQFDGQYSANPTSQNQHSQDTQARGTLKPLFIDRPINDLLRDRFPKMIKFREQFSLGWHGAEKLFNDRQSALFSDLDRDLSAYQTLEDATATRALPSAVTNDHFTDNEVSELSLPLVAMQFVLRHFVRCTDFCLVCHCSVNNTFEALKPYVCSNPLCLYQFLALGFGPSAEWEILSQPFVIDLLVSLCYAQARVGKLKEFPLGMGLKIPVLPHYKTAVDNIVHSVYSAPGLQVKKEVMPEITPTFKADYDPKAKKLSPMSKSKFNEKQTVKEGDWIALVPPYGSTTVYYCRVKSKGSLDYLLDPVIGCTSEDATKPSGTKKSASLITQVDCYLFGSDFDSLPSRYQVHAISLLLDTLPSIDEMRAVLKEQQERRRELSLNILRKRCPPAALELLRWIIASNRSCIMQVDDVASSSEPEKNLIPSEDRVSGMDDWMQFRFAQGAPDKEQRFVDSVKAKSGSGQYPTLFAWHGSPLYNWHSIIRQGLNFDEIANGRASGNGVYMSPHLNTSLGYMAGHILPASNICWPRSILKVTGVVSLQEVVNAPAQFVSNRPHFVVADKDWIQTRYLFVKTSARHSSGFSAKVTYAQDPNYAARGSGDDKISIPITAISRSRRPAETVTSKIGSKRRRLTEALPARFEDDLSVTTDQDDRDLLSFNEDDEMDYDSEDIVMGGTDEASKDPNDKSQALISSSRSKKRARESYILDSSKTDFVPGKLDIIGIRFFDPPSDASPSATRALLKAFNETLQTQATTPLHELGFYIDSERVENMYQWIIELHSFEQTLPLAKDMKAAGITSIVFEMQFTNDFPFSPPFVRVVKPRFLDPMSGGGGHITSGGAICMELLTSSGWSAVNSIESVLLQVRLAMSERERPARLLQNRGRFQTSPYDIGEAVAAYRRFCHKHGWKEPKGLETLRKA